MQLNQYQRYLERHQTYKPYENLVIDYSNFMYFLKLKTIDYPKRIANIFNNYFSITGKKTQAKKIFSSKNYTDYLTNENFNSFFLSPTDK